MKTFDFTEWAELSYIKYKWRKPFERYKWEYEEDIDEFLYEVEQWQVSME